MNGARRSSFKNKLRPSRKPHVESQGTRRQLERSLRSCYRSAYGYSVTEFGAAFYAFCICIVFPTICFLNFGVAFTYGFIASSVAADKASQAMNFEQAQRVLFDCKEKLRSDNIAQLIKVSPGVKPFQLDLVKSNSKGEVRVITYDTARRTSDSAKNSFRNSDSSKNNFRNSDSSSFRNSDSSRDILQYRILANYSVKPLIDLSSVPLMNQIPIIGKPTDISFQHLRIPEHSEYWTD